VQLWDGDSTRTLPARKRPTPYVEQLFHSADSISAELDPPIGLDADARCRHISLGRGHSIDIVGHLAGLVGDGMRLCTFRIGRFGEMIIGRNQ
jgi:hypothetical protein